MQRKDVPEFLSVSLEVYQALCQPICRDWDLPQTGLDILLFLGNNPEYPFARDVSRIRGIKPNMVSFHVDRLVNRGLLERQSVAGDRRQVKLVCTPAAQPLLARGRAVQQQFTALLTQGIGEEHLALVVECFQRFEENMQDAKQKFKKGSLL